MIYWSSVVSFKPSRRDNYTFLEIWLGCCNILLNFPLEGPSDGAAVAAAERGDLSVDQLLHGMNKRSSVIYLYRRSCIRRGGRCDHRPDDCCSGGACRCNLWGTNCQCQRMGIFQKWG
ncbi:unnamed protein product [Orchesella dallaii]|uniref:U8-agatoxin-Ao1a n=1 Tax=Orchesella dallaii TaxID=48710 RepID=A0ABP1PXB7_9HEXA